MSKETVYIGARVTPEERLKVQQLAQQANTTPSEVLRTLVRAAVEVKPLEVTITNWTHTGADPVAANMRA